ncbi:hypothetical protein BDA99DRAFT_533313 [Phascolomyces articulosus]|uniref:JmjC domain-containing protein n=1 Tax=Phascolomyces articulosus TaxID=60185 RepID=A0AAD5KLG9_9FUNG|nr:hypothetical protein BDA99DRAFT_533313 [Phascolomyces articulosus]
MTASTKLVKAKPIPKRQIKPEIIRANLHKTHAPLTPQRGGCWLRSSKLKIDRCRPCIAKKNEGCRFIDMRAFPTDSFEKVALEPKKNNKKIKNDDNITNENDTQDIVLEDDPYFISFDGPDPITKYEKKKKATHIQKNRITYRNMILPTICKAMVKMLQEDNQRVLDHGALIRRRAPFTNVRHVCDVCLTSIFNLHYMCAVCAMDICVDCYDKDWEEKDNLRIAHCTYRRTHTKDHLVPVIKYELKTLQKFQEQCSQMDVDDNHDKNMTTTTIPVNGENDPLLAATSTTPPPAMTTAEPEKENEEAEPIEKEEQTIVKDETVKEKNDFLIVDADVVTLEDFRACWRQGKPVMVQNVIDSHSQELWSPESFIKKYGKTETDVIDCKTGFVDITHVKDFFEAYIDSTLRHGYDKGKPVVLKIKDWPPKEDFVKKFPKLYKDFMRILPVKEYCTVDGSFNLSNRLPKEYLPPDLGPKMFIAYGSDQGEHSVGTTKLHCDMADAVNVMCHANKSDDRDAAIWDIFPYESQAAVRMFVEKIANEQNRKIRDPIHDQWLYLNGTLLERLEKEHGVKSWRLYQNPGDAVFIPAGCAHQVSNYHSAIKCAYDFVSPENIGRCLDITSQFGRVKREDALQLKNTLLFAWSELYYSDE